MEATIKLERIKLNLTKITLYGSQFLDFKGFFGINFIINLNIFSLKSCAENYYFSTKLLFQTLTII